MESSLFYNNGTYPVLPLNASVNIGLMIMLRTSISVWKASTSPPSFQTADNGTLGTSILWKHTTLWFGHYINATCRPGDI